MGDGSAEKRLPRIIQIHFEQKFELTKSIRTVTWLLFGFWADFVWGYLKLVKSNAFCCFFLRDLKLGKSLTSWSFIQSRIFSECLRNIKEPTCGDKEIRIAINLRKFGLRSLLFFIQFTTEANIVSTIICKHHWTAVMSLNV